MSSTTHKRLGYIVLATPFAGFFAFVCREHGWQLPALTLALTATVTALLWIGVVLVCGSGD